MKKGFIGSAFAGAAARGASCVGADCRSDHGRDKLVLDERDSCVALNGFGS